MFSKVPWTRTTGNGWAELGRQLLSLAPNGLALGVISDAASAAGNESASPAGAIRMARGVGLTDAEAGRDAAMKAAPAATTAVAARARRGRRFMEPLSALPRGRE
jgi:hypothetical protein